MSMTDMQLAFKEMLEKNPSHKWDGGNGKLITSTRLLRRLDAEAKPQRKSRKELRQERRRDEIRSVTKLLNTIKTKKG